MSVPFPNLKTACLEEKSYSQKIETNKTYLGSSIGGATRYIQNSEIVLSYVFINGVELDTFWYWFENTCKYGTEDFDIVLPFKDKTASILARFKTSIVEKIHGNATTLTFTIEVLQQ
jgi:hypothetical protein